MGIYLNSTTAYTLYKGETQKEYFVDKTSMLPELFPLINEGNNHICITRPRRFGKTVTANMIASFFSKGCDSEDVFGNLCVAKLKDYAKYRNQFPVIHITCNDIAVSCSSYEKYINRIVSRLVRDLKQEYPDTAICEDDDVIDIFADIYAENPKARFIFVLDEWDFIFHQDFVTEQDKKTYLQFLRSLLKDRPYVLLTYMTGILPISKYSSGSELNMFLEYTMASEEQYSQYFGFTESEADCLYDKYCKLLGDLAKITRADLKYWYDGYFTKGGRDSC